MTRTSTVVVAGVAWVVVWAALAGSAKAAQVDVWVLDRDGKPLPDAVVVLDSTVPGPRPTPVPELVISQEKMKFVPALAVAHLGTKVTFSNLDRWDHHVRGGLVGPGGVYVDPGKGYSFRLTGRERGKAPASHVQTYSQTGPQMLGCHLHGSMRAYLFVTDSPWAAITDSEGRLRLSGVPAGPARLKVWHADELTDTPARVATIVDGMPVLQLPTQVLPRKATRTAPEEAKMPGY